MACAPLILCVPNLLLPQTVDVQAKFVNGKPDKIECKYVMRRCAAMPAPTVVQHVVGMHVRSRQRACLWGSCWRAGACLLAAV